MGRLRVRNHSSWLAPLVVAVAVLLVGARLIALSVAERTDELRVTAQSAVSRHTRLIQSELAALGERARVAADLAAAPRSGASRPEPDTFLLDPAGTVLQAADATVAHAIAGELGAAELPPRGAGELFGPVRYGSEWIVAALSPSAGRWGVAYENLDALLAHADFGALVPEGYDFRLFQVDPATHRPRVFLSSAHEPLDEIALDAVRSPIRAAGASGDYLMLAIRPRTGWYPARALATEIGLLILLTWVFAFGAYDLTHSLNRTRAVLLATRARLHRANEKLVQEIEQRQTLQESVEHARFRDPFTGLPNRRAFMDQLDRALREVRTRRRRSLAIFLIDIDRFTIINDTLGHTAGDELMLQAAQRLAGVLQTVECLLARWSGDQLAVLVYDVASESSARTLARQLQEAGEEPFELRQHRLGVSSRIGFTRIDSGLQRTEDAMREADLALSVAKRQALPAVGYTAGMGGAAVSLVSLEADLHVALDRNEFRLLFQPIVDLRRQRVVGAEALLRWRHPVEGLLTPDKFLAIAEEAGVIVPVTRWVIQRVCRLAAEWRRRLPQGTDFYFSVNLSAAVLRHPGLRDYIARTLQETHTPAGNLKFEFTERGLISNVPAARELLNAFHNMGIELMLDDFGSGYSSLSYLQLFPFDYVKIDRPFASRTGSERANNAITSAILQLTSSLGLQAVAEVVETRAAADALRQMGCDFGQGYYFSAPVEAEEALRQLREGSLPDTGSAAAEDDSPTLILPPGVILASKIKDDAESHEEPSTS